MSGLFSLVVGVACLVAMVTSHGRLIEPPSRTSMWRFGYDTPKDYTDNQHNCGGLWAQINNAMQCGVCGDVYDEPPPREHEVGGHYVAEGARPIPATYQAGQTVEIQVDITANHKGYFQFSLCKVDSYVQEATQECLDAGVLSLEDGGTRYTLPNDNSEVFTVSVVLPEGVTCQLCVLQWKYEGGNNYGIDVVTGESCLGCGPQEHFFGCADVTITATGADLSAAELAELKATLGDDYKSEEETTDGGDDTDDNNNDDNNDNNNDDDDDDNDDDDTDTDVSEGGKNCRGVPPYDTESMNNWCNVQCNYVDSFCPESHCTCD